MKSINRKPFLHVKIHIFICQWFMRKDEIYMLCRHETISLWYLPRKKLSTMMPQLNSYYDMPASNLIVMCIYLTCFNEKKTVKELSATSTTMYYLLSNFLHSDSGREIGKVSRPIYSVASEQYLQSSHNLNLVFNVLCTCNV